MVVERTELQRLLDGIDWMMTLEVMVVANNESRLATGEDGMPRGRDIMAAAMFVLLKRAFPDCDQVALREAVLTRLEGGGSN